jgi:hypothetical protein
LRLTLDRNTPEKRIQLRANMDPFKTQSKLSLPRPFIASQLVALGVIAPESGTGTIDTEQSVEATDTSSADGNRDHSYGIAMLSSPSLKRNWELVPNQVEAMADWFEGVWRQRAAEHLAATESQLKALITQGSDSLARRAIAIDERMNDRQSDWNQLLQDFLRKVAEYEGQQLRAESPSATLTR